MSSSDKAHKVCINVNVLVFGQDEFFHGWAMRFILDQKIPTFQGQHNNIMQTAADWIYGISATEGLLGSVSIGSQEGECWIAMLHMSALWK